jgi:molybdopterin-containing oxidoreductase family iron-sulfur binding subunit
MSKLLTILKRNPHSDAPGEPAQWRSLDDLHGNSSLDALQQAESPQGALDIDQSDGVTRRGFMGLAGATLASASAALSGCIRKPTEHIVPYSKRPEDLVPGQPVYFATAAHIGGEVIGLLVESQEGRPTKIEGNPKHSSSAGKAGVLAQASVLDLYDPDRSQVPANQGADSSWDALWAAADGMLAEGDGAGVALLVNDVPSPTLNRLVAQLKGRSPKVQLYSYAPGARVNAAAGADLAGMVGQQTLLAFERARVVVALDSDFLGVEGTTATSAGFAAARRVSLPSDDMNRLYSIESVFSLTGTMADHRLRLPASQMGSFLAALGTDLIAGGLQLPAGAQDLAAALSGHGLAARHAPWVSALANDLLAHRGKSLVVVGEGQPAPVHALAHLLNSALGNVGETLSFVPRNTVPGAMSIVSLSEALDAGTVQTLVILGGNPAYDAPVDLDFGTKMGKVDTSIHLSDRLDETSSLATWHVPAAHYLEAWGDLHSADGTVAIQQPLIAPLYGAVSGIELLSHLTGSGSTGGRDLVAETWKSAGGLNFDQRWRTWLHDGVVEVVEAIPLPVAAPVEQPASDGASDEEAATGAAADATEMQAAAVAEAPAPAGPGLDFSALPAAWAGLESHTVSSESLEVQFRLDGTVYDGSVGNNPWLQELPDPMSKLTWDNAAVMNPATASALGVAAGDMVSISLEGRSLEIAAFVMPGAVDNSVLLPLGYGRDKGGRFASGAGFNSYTLRSSTAMNWAVGATLSPTGATYELAGTQNYGRLDPKLETPFGVIQYERRTSVREASLDQYRETPDWVEEQEVIAAKHLKSLWTEPNVRDGQQWGMSIDLNVCTGCSACTIACQAENNIMVVGKERVARGREMSWIRMDRYFTGDEENPQAVVQPVACAHCETAPCEQVCPVAATAHSPDGLNDIAYNRCIGTRYCANNCPFKVRRFNFFNYSKENDAAAPLTALQMNPDVTVRFRGVVEKCSYCVQRISKAKIEAKVDGDGVVDDGKLVPACAQACPTDAIVFGDINDKDSRVAQAKADPRTYAMLAELNIHPRTTYQGKLRNTNSAMPGAAVAKSHDDHGSGPEHHEEAGH